jgi:hypothetical protein
MYAGTDDTRVLYDTMGEQYINENKIFIKFACVEVVKKEGLKS